MASDSVRTRSQKQSLLSLWCAALVVLGATSTARAQEMEAPVEIQVSLFLKVLAYDRSQVGVDRIAPAFAIVYQGRNRASVAAKDEAARAFASSGASVNGVALRLLIIDLDTEELETVLSRGSVSLLYVTPLRSLAVSRIATTAQQAGVLTVTGVRRYVSDGVVVGVHLVGERPKLVVNLPAMRAAKVDFPAELLKLVQVLP